MNKEQGMLQIKRLIARYEKLTPAQRKKYNESMTCKDFILPLFQALGWDVYNNDGRNEVTSETQVSGKRVDYAFYVKDVIRMFIEAKKIEVDLRQVKYGEQAVMYAWHKSVPWAILTDFESVKVYNAEWDEPDPERSLLFEIKHSEYLTDGRLWLLSKASMQKGELDEYAEKHFKKPKREPVDKLLANDLIRWRTLLFNDLKGWNSDKNLTDKQIAESVQRLLDRFIFIRTTEDRGLEGQRLRELVRNWENDKTKIDLAQEIIKLFKEYDRDYNSKLFLPHICDKLEYENGFLADIIKELYKNNKGIRYNFASINADVLGSIYEQYLGKIQQEEADKKSTKRKSQGIFYTPRYIVDYIVKNTLGEALKGKSGHQARQIKILDPACGSGSFLIKAFEVLDEHIKRENHQVNASKITNFARKVAILTSNIYGVDLDEEAVEIAQLNLLLKALEKRERLPNLAHNIECGNSLISGDEEELKKYFGKDWKDKRPFNWEEKFKDVIKQGGFDVIIGNPPYVRVDSLEKSDKELWKNIYETSMGKYDLYYLFIEKSIKLLKEGGKLGFIVPNKFCVASSAKKLREFILNNSKQCEIYSVSQLDVFFGAANYPVIIFLTKGIKLHKLKVGFYKTEDEIINRKFIGYMLNHNEQKRLPNNIFPININEKQLRLALKLIEDNHKLFEYLKISEGLRIPAKFEQDKKDNMGIVKQYQFERYSTIKEGSFVSEKDLKKVVSDKSERYKNSIKEKILIAEDALFISATLDKKRYIPQGGVYFGTAIRDNLYLEYLTALLNSKLLSFIYKILFGGMHMGGGYLRYRTEFLNELPIVEVSKKNQKTFVDLVNKMITLNSQLQKLHPIMDEKEYNDIKKEIKKVDNEIDEKVYKLYGLTKKEIAVIEK